MAILKCAKCSTAALLLFGCGALMAATGDSGYLEAKVNPGRAGVFVDGKYLGPAANFGFARKYTVAAGDHEVRLVDPRYEEAVEKVTIVAGKKTEVHKTLTALPLAQPPFGRLRTYNADKFAAVYINDKFYGHAGEFNNPVQGLLLKPGEYDVKIVPASGTPVTQHVKIEADKTVIVR
jgi:hypothetical protein